MGESRRHTGIEFKDKSFRILVYWICSGGEGGGRRTAGEQPNMGKKAEPEALEEGDFSAGRQKAEEQASG